MTNMSPRNFWITLQPRHVLQGLMKSRKVEEQLFSPAEQHSYHGNVPLVPPTYFISETECQEEKITRFAQLKRSLAKRLGTTSSSACDQRFNTQVTHCVSQIQKDVQMSCTLNRNGITGVLQCNRASLWKEQGGDAASRDVEVRIRRRLVFFWDKPRGGTKKNKKISNGLEQSPSQPPPLCTRVFFILFLWIICCLEWQQSQNSLLKKKQKTTPLPPSFSSPMLVTNSRLQQQTHWSLHLLH